MTPSNEHDRVKSGINEIVLVAVGTAFKPLASRFSLPLSIGRGEQATLTVADPLISREHCTIFVQDGKLMVRDLDSLNGTFVGTQRVSSSLLPFGELLTVGPLTFRVEPGDAKPPGVTWCSADEFAERLTDSSAFGNSPLTQEDRTPPSNNPQDDLL